MFDKKKLLPALFVVVAGVLFLLGPAIVVIDFAVHKTISREDVVILGMIGGMSALVILFLLPQALVARFALIKVPGLELQTRIQEVKEDVQTLRKQVYTLGQTAIVQQVNTLNRLAIERPELAQKAWQKLENFEPDQIRQLSYAYAFIDIFDMLRRFHEHDELAKELYDLWRTEWMPDLLASQTGKLMKDNRVLLDYYSDKTRDALGLSRRS